MTDQSNTELRIDTTPQIEWKVAEPYKTDYVSNIVPLNPDQTSKIIGQETNKNIPTELLSFLQSNNHDAKIKYSVRVNESNQTSVVGELSLSANNKLVVVLKSEFEKSDEYEEFLQRKQNNQITDDEKMNGFFGQKDTKNIRAKNIILTDETNNTAVDMTKIFPEVAFNYAAGKKLDNSTYNDGEHVAEKVFTIGNLTESDSPMLAFAGKLHEMGHRAMEIQTPPERYAELTQLMQEAMAAGKPSNLSSEKIQPFKELLSENEVGAWMHALIIKRALQSRGIVLNVTDEEVISFANEKLGTYEQAFGDGNKMFEITESNLQNLPQII